jgi:hypothetical protein
MNTRRSKAKAPPKKQEKVERLAVVIDGENFMSLPTYEGNPALDSGRESQISG